MAKLEESARCETCDQQTLVRTEYIPHLFFLILTALTGGIVGLFWAIRTVVWRPRWLCSRCGTVCDGPRWPVGHDGWWLAAVIWLSLQALVDAAILIMVFASFAFQVVGELTPGPTPAVKAVAPQPPQVIGSQSKADRPTPPKPDSARRRPQGEKGGEKTAPKPPEPEPKPDPKPEPPAPKQPDPVPPPREPARPEPKPADKPLPEEEEEPVPKSAITLGKRPFYLLGETPGDIQAYVLATTNSPIRGDLERRGKVVRYTDPPVVVVLGRDRYYGRVDVWSGPLKGKQRYVPSDYLPPAK